MNQNKFEWFEPSDEANSVRIQLQLPGSGYEYEFKSSRLLWLHNRLIELGVPSPWIAYGTELTIKFFSGLVLNGDLFFIQDHNTAVRAGTYLSYDNRGIIVAKDAPRYKLITISEVLDRQPDETYARSYGWPYILRDAC